MVCSHGPDNINVDLAVLLGGRLDRDGLLVEMKEREEVDEIALDEAHPAKVFELLFLEAQMAELAHFVAYLIDIRHEIDIRRAAAELVFRVRRREVMQHDLHHRELVEIGIEQRMDNHGSRRTARKTGKGASRTAHKRADKTANGPGTPQCTACFAPGGLQCMLPEVSARSATPTLAKHAGQRACGSASATHKQITKRYKAFWPGVALKYTGTLQYRFWRADRAQSGYIVQPRIETLG